MLLLHRQKSNIIFRVVEINNDRCLCIHQAMTDDVKVHKLYYFRSDYRHRRVLFSQGEGREREITDYSSDYCYLDISKLRMTVIPYV